MTSKPAKTTNLFEIREKMPQKFPKKTCKFRTQNDQQSTLSTLCGAEAFAKAGLATVALAKVGQLIQLSTFELTGSMAFDYVL